MAPDHFGQVGRNLPQAYLSPAGNSYFASADSVQNLFTGPSLDQVNSWTVSTTEDAEAGSNLYCFLQALLINRAAQLRQQIPSAAPVRLSPKALPGVYTDNDVQIRSNHSKPKNQGTPLAQPFDQRCHRTRVCAYFLYRCRPHRSPTKKPDLFGQAATLGLLYLSAKDIEQRLRQVS